MIVRYWWLKRLSITAAILLAGLAASRWWWGREMDRRLRAEIDKIHDAGEPIYPDDFDPPAIPDEDNAVILLLEAGKAMALTQAQHESLVTGYSKDPLHRRKQLQSARKLLGANVRTFDLVRRARSRGGSDWGVPVRPNTYLALGRVQSDQRRLALLLYEAALYHHQIGDDATAVEYLRDMETVAVGMAGHPPSFVSHLVVIGITALQDTAIEAVVADLTIDDAPARETATPRPATREQVLAWIEELLADAWYGESLQHAYQAERVLLLDLMTSPTPISSTLGSFFAPPGEEALVRCLRPAFQAEAIRVLRYFTVLAESAQADNWPTATSRLPQPAGHAPGLSRVSSWMSGALVRTYERGGTQHWTALTMRRLAAAALAIRLFELDHGRRPDSLDELVPDYLPAIPLDPMAPGRRVIGYKPGADKPVLYSVGEDGVDKQGRYTLDGGHVAPAEWGMFFFLNGDRPGSRDGPQTTDTQPAGLAPAANE